MTFDILRSARLVLVATSCGLLVAAPARAEDAPKTENQIKAGALFSEGRKLAETGDYQHACPKFEQSLRLNVGIGAQFNLADCWERIGRTASAYALFQGAAATARAVGQTDREQVAQARAVALEPRLVRMLIEVRATDKDLVVRRNQIVVEHPAWDTATPIDAGTYLIEASATGKKPWSTRVTVPATAIDVISIIVPPLTDAAASCEPGAVVPGAAVVSSTAEAEQKALRPRQAPLEVVPPPEPASAPRSKRRVTYTVALAGLGVASVGLGAFFALESRSKNNSAEAICPASINCSRAQIYNHGAYLDDAKTFRTWSFVGFGVGSAALVGAAVLYLAPTGPASPASGWGAAPFVTADGSWGATATGRF